jgi:hypothetical protein
MYTSYVYLSVYLFEYRISRVSVDNLPCPPFGPEPGCFKRCPGQEVEVKKSEKKKKRERRKVNKQISKRMVIC